MINILDKKKCNGCTACASVCHKNAIKMSFINGFEYPVVNSSLCVNCGACERVCPYLTSGNEEDTYNHNKTFAMQANDKADRYLSTAGGFFSVLANHFLNNGGIVYGVVYEKGKIKHVRFETKIGLEKCYGSKYVQSDLHSIFSSIMKDLGNKKKVLFSGTPCQVFGLKQLAKNNVNLFTIDVVCYGVSSPEIFSEYITFLECKYKSQIDSFYFRDKHYGYSTSNVMFVLSNGKRVQQNYYCKCLTGTFFKNLNMRLSCYDCIFRKKESESDFTIGDFVNIGEYSKKMDDDRGTTKLIVHSAKGEEIINKIRDRMQLLEISINYESIASNRVLDIPSKRDAFFSDFDLMDFSSFIKKWEPNSFKKRLICLFRKTSVLLPFRSAILKRIRRKQYHNFHKK